ncbi:MAG: choice-of-anchor Q domain-containing protein, partial [Bacteroidota bacterium]
NDSAYIFVTVSINPSAANLPFVVTDSIEINYNGNKKWVQLNAYGSNANFLRNKIVSTNETWNNTRPYIILGSLIVEPNATLTINEGSKIYVHADAPIIINGTLNVAGNFYDSTRVVFSGDRLDEPYRDFPASFPGLVFTASSKNNLLSYATIKNAYQGLVVIGPAGSGIKLTLNQTIIENAYDAGILGINTSITANNLLVSNCGKNMLLINGGNYNFIHCTSVAYSNSFLQHKDPLLGISNSLSANGSTTINNLSALFRNCIFWGEGTGLVPSEVVIAKQGVNPFSVLFDGVLWRVPSDPVFANITGNNIKNLPPLFDSINTSNRFYNFRLKEGSPAINKGVATSVNIDLDGKPRPVGAPDLGAYEKQ